MFKKLRNPLTVWCFISVYLISNLFSYGAMAFHGGPRQPETQTFTPHDVTQMVDPFTGDFTYNIPLMDVGGYPINLSYKSGIGMHDEASFVGLGWNLNPGAITRQVRGLPDDFKADTIQKAYHMRPDETIGTSTGANAELFGFDFAKVGLGVQIGVTKSSYRGYGLDYGFTPSISISGQSSSLKLSASLGVSSTDGGYFNPNVGLSFSSDRALGRSIGIGLGMNTSSREGLKERYFSGSYTRGLVKGLQVHKGQSASVGGNFPISFASPTFTPTSEMPMSNTSFSLRFKVGVEVYGTMVDFFGSGFYSQQALSKSSEEFPSYGYLYAHEAGDDRVLTDFNREKDGPYQREIPNLPLTNFTYDVYSVSGQGMNGQFRPFRSDIGTLSDTPSSSSSTGVNGGGEVAFGNLVHAGVDVVVNATNEHTRLWRDENGLLNPFHFRDSVANNPAYEPVYFKSVGEQTAMRNKALFDSVGGFDAMYAPVANGSVGNRLTNGTTGKTVSYQADESYKTQREPRNINFSYLTAQQASDMAIARSIENYPSWRSTYVDDFTGGRWYPFVPHRQKRVGDIRKPHHLSEIIVTRDDGARYVYGIPVYSVKQKEVSFNVSKYLGAGRPALPHNDDTGLVDYTGEQNDLPNNGRGLDQFYHATETPAHANAFLLTTILSNDYVDITGNGPTTDDFGTYTKFNYTQVHKNYRWRTPYEQNKAQYQNGFESDALDDKGSYVYGEKEIWYLQSIETKNYVAEFSLLDRDDGLGVLGEHGGKDASQRLKKLDRITLYTQGDRLKHGTEAIPIKTVYFDYSYELCKDTPDGVTSGIGKLTLTKVSFSYGKSGKDKLSPYVFTYSSQNPVYHAKGGDRWGSYKPNDVTQDNTRFPYTTQQSVTDQYASAWNLVKIKLPSGGIVNIEYESDDYGYVQNKRAMEMVKIIGVRKTPGGTSSFSAADSLLYDVTPNAYLFFKLGRPTNNPSLLQEYLSGIEDLYFNCKVAARYDTSSSQKDEFIEGFIPLQPGSFGEHYGFYEGERIDGKYTIGWLKLPMIRTDHSDAPAAPGTTGMNPITKATLQKLRKSLPRAAYDRDDPVGFNDFSNMQSLVNELGVLVGETDRVLNGYNEWMMEKQKGKFIDLSQSFIRLNNADKDKYGGGSRVKSLTISDAWGNMVPSVPELQNFSYGEEYSYTTTETVGDTVRTISAGVASYEPLIGGDENPFVLPLRYQLERPLALDVNYYITMPLGESFFPAPQVGYSNVTVRNLKREGVRRTATGFTQHEFYTAKDFPTQVRQTDLISSNSEIPGNPFYTEKKATVSQGYCIELNDMHGKVKAEKVFQEINDENPISGIEYTYQTEDDNVEQLNNRVTVLNAQTGITEERLVGVEYDFILDAREMKSESWGPGVNINTDGFMASFIPLFIPVPYPEMSASLSQYRGVTTTKVIQRSGLLKEVIAYDLGSRITTSNVLYDGETGKVIITKTQNEFEDDYYTSHIPAHWVYEGMGSAYRNSGIAFNELTCNNGNFSIHDASSFFVNGDELMLFRKDSVETVYATRESTAVAVGTRSLPPVRSWLLQTNESSISVIDELGKPVKNGVYDFKVLRSGRRNMSFTALGSITTKRNPIEGGRLNFAEVINAAAVEYNNYWETYAGFLVPKPQTQCSCDFEQGNYNGVISVNAMQRLLEALLTSGNYKRSNVNLNVSPYDQGYLTKYVGLGRKTYYGEINGNFVEGFIRNDHEGVARDFSLRMEMTDPSLNFPDSIQRVALVNPLLDPDGFTCDDDIYKLNFKIDYINDAGALSSAHVTFTSTRFSFFHCEESVAAPTMNCAIAGGASVNPYLLGILGNWRPKANYAYVTERTNGSIRNKGTFSDFHSFWQPLHFSLLPAADQSAWQWVQKNTIADPFGKVLEQKDALNRFASNIYGYGFNVPVASAANARYHQIAFEGFEDNAFRNSVSTPFEHCPLPPHWKFNVDDINIINTESHTGKYSIQVNDGENITSVVTPLCDPDTRVLPTGNVYPIQDCDLIRNFSPPPGEYIVQAWVKEGTSLSELITQYTNASLEVAITQSGITQRQTFKAAGHIVDGWQPIEGSFIIPEACEAIQVSLKSTRTAYFDDIRLQPANASMEAYVYDPVSLRLVATLDDRNYATFYEYDQEGSLTRKKKETERGVLTLQEVRVAKQKN